LRFELPVLDQRADTLCGAIADTVCDAILVDVDPRDACIRRAPAL
jgi:hypothetical protein